MKRSWIVASAVAIAVAGASVAEAAVKTGTFRGKTTARDNVGFTVPKKNRVADFYFAGLELTCTDGDKFETGTGKNRQQTPAGKRYKVRSSGKFSIKYRNKRAGSGWNVKGKFKSKGSRVTGTISAYANFDISNNATPNGEIKCKSGAVKFSVKRK